MKKLFKEVLLIVVLLIFGMIGTLSLSIYKACARISKKAREKKNSISNSKKIVMEVYESVDLF